jgi:HSP20 family protein
MARDPIDRIRGEMEELFAELWQAPRFTRRRGGYRPPVDVYRSARTSELTVVVELPGVDPAEVQLIASPRALLVAGERRRPKDYGQYQQMGIDYGPFQRQVTLAEDVNPEEATATYERGILTIRLPIAPRPAPAESISIEVTLG